MECSNQFHSTFEWRCSCPVEEHKADPNQGRTPTQIEKQWSRFEEETWKVTEKQQRELEVKQSTMCVDNFVLTMIDLKYSNQQCHEQ